MSYLEVAGEASDKTFKVDAGSNPCFMLNRKGSSCGGTPSNTILQHLSTALHRIEQAWFTSAEKTRCFQIDTLEQQDREGVSRMKPVRLNSGGVGC